MHERVKGTAMDRDVDGFGARSAPLGGREVLLPCVLFVVGLPLLWTNYGLSPLLVAVHLLLCGVLVLRGRRPMAVFVLVLVLALLPPVLADAHVTGELGLFAAYYHLVVRRPLAWTLVASLLFLVGVAVMTLRPLDPLPSDLGAGLGDDAALFVAVLVRLITALGMVVIALVTGVLALVVRDRRAAVAAAKAEAEQLRRERDQRTRLAQETERNRIARELHDVVGHSLGVMVSLSEGSARLAGSQPERAEKAMRTVAETGREALFEVREVLGLLRNQAGNRSPDRDVVELVERVRVGGTDVVLHMEGDLPGLPGRERLCVYRIVQEALTNVRKHVGTEVGAKVDIRVTDERVAVEVTDDGFGGTRTDTGAGLTGLEERVSIQGGTIDAGPMISGGWRVRAEFPVRRRVGEVAPT